MESSGRNYLPDMTVVCAKRVIDASGACLGDRDVTCEKLHGQVYLRQTVRWVGFAWEALPAQTEASAFTESTDAEGDYVSTMVMMRQRSDLLSVPSQDW